MLQKYHHRRSGVFGPAHATHVPCQTKASLDQPLCNVGCRGSGLGPSRAELILETRDLAIPDEADVGWPSRICGHVASRGLMFLGRRAPTTPADISLHTTSAEDSHGRAAVIHSLPTATEDVLKLTLSDDLSRPLLKQPIPRVDALSNFIVEAPRHPTQDVRDVWRGIPDAAWVRRRWFLTCVLRGGYSLPRLAWEGWWRHQREGMSTQCVERDNGPGVIRGRLRCSGLF